MESGRYTTNQSGFTGTECDLIKAGHGDLQTTDDTHGDAKHDVTCKKTTYVKGKGPNMIETGDLYESI